MFGKPPPQQIYFGRKIQKTCRFWMRGTCRFGDTCRYLHEHSPSEPARMTPRAFLAREGGIDHFVQSLDEREKERLRRLLAADGAQDYPQPEHEYSLRPLRGHEQPEHDYQLRAQRASDEAYLRALDADAEALLQRAGAAEYLQQRAEAAEYLRALDAEYLRPGEGYLARQELPPRRPSSDDLELPASFAGLALSSDEAGSEGSSPLPPAEEGHWEWTPEGWGR
ncbi:hypothetical protein DFJ74DRAFT_685408 [Hyaloraphidium curvatum]|nr:hypothetical protein DFJ74DRAFT_685408 [Hyaloraphidium curvatum]